MFAPTFKLFQQLDKTRISTSPFIGETGPPPKKCHVLSALSTLSTSISGSPPACIHSWNGSRLHGQDPRLYDGSVRQSVCTVRTLYTVDLTVYIHVHVQYTVWGKGEHVLHANHA